MTSDHEATEIEKKARKLLQSGISGSFVVRKSGRVGKPIPILEPDEDFHSWFVPITVGPLLAGFFEFRADQTFLRYSSFQRHDDSLVGCPEVKLWTDVNAIQRRVETVARPAGKALRSFLTYDRTPSRLAWMVVLKYPDGGTRSFYAAGDAVWEASTASRTNTKGGGSSD